MKDFKGDADIIRKLYPKYAKCSDVWLNEMYANLQSQQLITEYLHHTINSQKTQSELNRRFPGQFTSCEIVDSNKLIVIEFKNNQFKNILEINQFLDSFGWFPKLELNQGAFNYEKMITRYHKKFNFTILYESKFNNIKVAPTGSLYHLTPDIFIKKIKLFGLTPRTKSELVNYPERIYLLNKTNELEDIALELYNKLSVRSKELIEYYYVLKIETEKIKDYDFFVDRDFMLGNGGIWTFRNIAPIFIKIVDKILVNPHPKKIDKTNLNWL